VPNFVNSVVFFAVRDCIFYQVIGADVAF